MKNRHHQDLLAVIRDEFGAPKTDPFLNHYLGTTHPLYDLRAPALREIAKTWTRMHKDMHVHDFQSLLTSLVEGKSATEKMLAGMLLDYAGKAQRAIDPGCFDRWLEHLQGWAEVDMLCTNKYTVKQLPLDWKKWVPLLEKFSRSRNIHKRRASLVFLCAPIRKTDDEGMLNIALENVERLKHEKHALITKAVSWILRSAVKLHKKKIKAYVESNRDTLPAIAVRETLKVIETGRKTALR